MNGKIENDREFLNLLKIRFEENMSRHSDIKWETIEAKLNNNRNYLNSVRMMEDTSGEPDVVMIGQNDEIIICDCSKESPIGRRSICYDHEALLSRKKFPPGNSAINMAKEMGITILTEEMYKKLQSIEEVDLKTSSWVLSPKDIREKGGAIFCDNRYGNVFTYHNGADSYYGARGFRGYLILK